MMRKLRQMILRFQRKEEGATAIEFALIAIPFFLVFLALFEMSTMLLAQYELQQAMTSAARAIRTGQARTGITLSEFKTNYVCPRLIFVKCDRVRIEAKNFTSFGDVGFTDVSGGFLDDPSRRLPFSIGGPSEVMGVRMFYKWRFYTPMIGQFMGSNGNGTRYLSAGTVFRNEPYN